MVLQLLSVFNLYNSILHQDHQGLNQLMYEIHQFHLVSLVIINLTGWWFQSFF